MSKLDELTYGEIKDIFKIFEVTKDNMTLDIGLNDQIGEKVIIRTYSAGVWFGTLYKKSGKEVLLENARRMYKWWAKKSISLSGVAKYGIIQEKSKICPEIGLIWLESIEILRLTPLSIESIEEAPDAEAYED
jgi:hypothetical protein